MDTGAARNIAQFEIAETVLAGPSNAGALRSGCIDPTDILQRYLATRPQLRFRVHAAANRCDTYRVAPWLLMTVVDVGCVQRFESALSGQDIVEFHFRLSGSIELAGSWGEVRVREPACLLWYQPKGCDDASELVGDPGRSRESWVSLYCDRTTLLGMADGATQELLDAITGPEGSRTVPQFRIWPRIGMMIPVLREIVRARTEDPLHWMLTFARAHELLYMTLRSGELLGSERASTLRLTARDRKSLGAVRDLLVEHYVSPPALVVLARRVGMNPARLCSGFRLQFGESTSEFVRRRRMEVARELLQRSDMQVRQVARSVGYSHHSTFTAAFARHFGIAPKVLRRQLPALN
jgi:AraC-like DNA-binding protein